MRLLTRTSSLWYLNLKGCRWGGHSRPIPEIPGDNMKRLILLSAILFLASIPAKAQSSYPSTEIFGGYSYASTELITRRNTNGFGASFAGNLSENWGFVGEISGHYGKDVFNFPIIGDVEVKFNKYLFLGGPRYSKRGNAATGFAHVLVGGAKLNVEGQDGTGLAVAIVIVIVLIAKK